MPHLLFYDLKQQKVRYHSYTQEMYLNKNISVIGKKYFYPEYSFYTFPTLAICKVVQTVFLKYNEPKKKSSSAYSGYIIGCDSNVRKISSLGYS